MSMSTNTGGDKIVSEDYPSADERLKALTDKLESGISDIFQSGQYAEYLTTMSKFHPYSFGNIMLIFMQRPNASSVAGYHDWKNKFGRQVKAGEKGIKILAPCPYQKWVQMEKIDPQTQQPMRGADGQPVMEWVKAEKVRFKIVTVFDISQTEGKELPLSLVSDLSGDVAEYERVVTALQTLSPFPVVFEAFPQKAKGLCSYAEQRILIQPGMSQTQTVKTLVHEIAHAKLHAQFFLCDKGPSRSEREMEAESVAFVVCQHLGIDTSNYSFGYVAEWSQGKDMTALKASLDLIRSTAAELIDGIEGREKEQAPPQRKNHHSRKARRRTPPAVVR